MKKIASALLFTLIISPVALAQNSFSLGMKAGPGYMIPRVKTVLIQDGTQRTLRTFGGKSFGFLGQYIIGEKAGIETGILIQRKSFSKKNPLHHIRGVGIRWDPDVTLTAFQIPIQLLYKFDHPRNPFVHFKVTAGVSLDWLFAYTSETMSPNPLFSSNNLLLGIRAGNARGKVGRIEFGIEYQYSLDKAYNFHLQQNNKLTTFKTKNQFLLFGFYYYFLNRDV